MTGDDLMRMIHALPGSTKRCMERTRSFRSTCDAVIEALDANGLEIVTRQPTLDDAELGRFSVDVDHRGGLL